MASIGNYLLPSVSPQPIGHGILSPGTSFLPQGKSVFFSSKGHLCRGICFYWKRFKGHQGNHQGNNKVQSVLKKILAFKLHFMHMQNSKSSFVFGRFKSMPSSLNFRGIKIYFFSPSVWKTTDVKC